VAMGNHARALIDRSEAVRMNPDSAEAYLARGGTYHELGRHREGIADRSTAISLRPDWADAWLARGSANYLLGDYQAAVDDLKEALRLKPNDAEAQSVLAIATDAMDRQLASAKAAPAKAPAA